MLRFTTPLIAILLGLAMPLQAATLVTTESRYTSSQAIGHGQVGYAVGRDGQWLVIGARRETAGTRAEGGAVYVYLRQSDGSFTEYQRLTATDTNLNDNDHFGASVAVSGNTLVVGAPDYDGPDPASPKVNSGRAYVFEFNATGCSKSCWSQVQALTGSGVDANDVFGGSVDTDGTTIVVGAVNDEVGATSNEGAAYLFIRSGSAWVADPGSPIGPRPVAAPSFPDVQFGRSVAVSGDLVAVGAPSDDEIPLDAGAMYIFNRTTGWAEESKLLGQAGELFGSAIDLDGTTLVAGATSATINGQLFAGLVRVYDRSSGPAWSLSATLLPLQSDNVTADSAASDFFGSAVAIAAGGVKHYIVVGAYQNDDGGNGTGSAYLYQDRGSGWGQLAKLNASDAAAADGFGFSVAVGSDSAVIGAPFKDVSQIDSGAIYTYELTDTDDDGLSDALEVKICADTGGAVCTDISRADSDGDGISDFDELLFGDGDPATYTAGVDLNPVKADTDGDKFSDGDELLVGSDPLDSGDIPADGDINGDGNVDVVDVLKAARMAIGLQVPTPAESIRGNVAPLNAGVPDPVDAVIGSDDLLLIERKALGAVTF